MSNEHEAIAERVATKLVGTRPYRVHEDQAVWDRTTFEIDVPNDITSAEDIDEYVRTKIEEDRDKYEVSSTILSNVAGIDIQYEINPA